MPALVSVVLTLRDRYVPIFMSTVPGEIGEDGEYVTSVTLTSKGKNVASSARLFVVYGGVVPPDDSGYGDGHPALMFWGEIGLPCTQEDHVVTIGYPIKMMFKRDYGLLLKLATTIENGWEIRVAAWPL